VQESDVELFGTLARSLVNKAHFLPVTFSQCVDDTVLNGESHMMDTVVALVKPLLNCAVGRCRLKQFKLDFAAAQKGCLYLLVSYFFYCITFQTENVLKIRQSLFMLCTAMPRCSMCEIFIY